MERSMRGVLVGTLLLLFGLGGEGSLCGPSDPTAWEVPGTDYADMGSFEVVEDAGVFAAPSGCTLPYTRYRPMGGEDSPLVLLTHGFQRGEAQMQGLARHLAGWGLDVVTPDLCHASAQDHDVAADVSDMTALADAMRAGRGVVYAGHSAGGLRSLLAGRDDEDAIAVFGLDLVDGDGLALAAAPELDIPLYGVAGEPSACNEDGNGEAVYQAAPEGLLLGVTEADHCDFEDPTDRLCTAVCASRNETFSDDTIRNAIRGLFTAFLLWRGGLDPEGAAWWTPEGEAYQWLIAQGLIERRV
ncbi:MAG: alpha/beta fold hydrolase [Deltaproteobacteria bacterium]|nr:MAG: alpha/beta fold hydrolase [Deltaproteobacteria bacterium]